MKLNGFSIRGLVSMGLAVMAATLFIAACTPSQIANTYTAITQQAEDAAATTQADLERVTQVEFAYRLVLLQIERQIDSGDLAGAEAGVVFQVSNAVSTALDAVRLSHVNGSPQFDAQLVQAEALIGQLFVLVEEN